MQAKTISNYNLHSFWLSHNLVRKAPSAVWRPWRDWVWSRGSLEIFPSNTMKVEAMKYISKHGLNNTFSSETAAAKSFLDEALASMWVFNMKDQGHRAGGRGAEDWLLGGPTGTYVQDGRRRPGNHGALHRMLLRGARWAPCMAP